MVSSFLAKKSLNLVSLSATEFLDWVKRLEMSGIWISIAAKIVEYLVEPILNQFDYLINFNDNVEDLTKQVEKLEAINLKVKQLMRLQEGMQKTSKWM